MYSERIDLYKSIENVFDTKLLVYVTSARRSERTESDEPKAEHTGRFEEGGGTPKENGGTKRCRKIV